MAKHHFIPAAFLGRFSVDNDPVYRHRNIWIASRSPLKAYGSRAENFAAREEYYALLDPSHQSSSMVDDVWSEYEQQLNPALDELCDPAPESMNGSLWLRVVVPFIAGVFVRGPHFSETQIDADSLREISRHFEKSDHFYSDSVNMSRNMAMQRALAPLMAARWRILHAPFGDSFIATDVGYANFPRRSMDLVIPLGPKVALALTPCGPNYGRKILYDEGEGRWRAIVEHLSINRQDLGVINTRLGKAARRFIICPSREEALSSVEFLKRNPGVSEVDLTVLSSPRMQRVHEFDWYRAVTLTARPFAAIDYREIDVDWAEVAAGWHPVPMIPTNLPNFHSGLRCHGKSISLYMTGVDGFTDRESGVPWDPITGRVIDQPEGDVSSTG